MSLKIKLLDIKDEDFVNYKKASMYIAFPHCSFKCGCDLCQNYALSKQTPVEISMDAIVDRYVNNPITEAIVFAGLEPFNDEVDLINLISSFRKKTDDDIVIYTGFNKEEIKNYIDCFINILGFKNIIIKYGRYIPNQTPHKDEVLGVNLASDNQYAERIC